MDSTVEERVVTMTKLEFFEEWLKHDKSDRISRIFDNVCVQHNISDASEDSLRKLKMKISSLSSKLNEKWASSKCTKDTFLIKYKDWLEGSGIEMFVCVNQTCPSTLSGIRSVGRPQKSFDESSTKTKRRRVRDDLLKSRSANELITAAELATRKEGHRSVAKQIRSAAASDSLKKSVLAIDSRRSSSSSIDTRKLYLDLYSWYLMPVTVHKILLHSAEVIRSCLLPIGQLSEEAQEARNKDCRRFRERHTRKRSRGATNTDLLRMLLITSDPVINTFRELPRKKFTTLPPEVLQLIVPPSLPSQSTSLREFSEGDYSLSEDSSELESGDEESSDDDY